MNTASYAQAKDLAVHILKAKRVPMLHGTAGNAKSSLAKDIAKMFGLFLIDIRLSTYDLAYLTGLPDTSGDKTRLKPIDTFPLEDTPIPEGYNGFLLFLDELTSVAPSMEAASYRILLDREVGDKKLHPKCLVMGAGNGVGQGAIARKQSTPVQTRMMHIPMKVTAEEFVTHGVSIGMDARVLSYINAKPDHLEAYDPTVNDYTYRNPRSWHQLSDVLKAVPDITHKHQMLIASAIGTMGVMDFIAFTQVYDQMPSFHEILANPKGVTFQDSPNVQWAMTGTLASQIDKENTEAIMEFLPRLGIEFQMMFFKMAMAKTPSLREHPAIKEWIKVNAKKFY